MQPLDLESYLHQNIPASASLGIGVKRCSPEKVELTAPLSANLNHKNTAFGGSLSVIAITSGWSLVFMRLLGTRNEIVIQESHMSYLAPVRGDFSAISTYEVSPQWSKFMRLYERHGKGRIMIESGVFCHGELVAQHTGTYVALKT